MSTKNTRRALITTSTLFLLSFSGLPVVCRADVPNTVTNPARNFEEVVTRAIQNENSLLQRMKNMRPVVETYIQQMRKDADFGAVPSSDTYFLGQLDMSRGVVQDSFIPAPGMAKRILHSMSGSKLFKLSFLPSGFATMIMMDPGEFDRQHYTFKYLRREFLGDVRCIVADVMPQKNSGHGRFEGRVWIEDEGYNVVRFNGTYKFPPMMQGYSHFDSWRVNSGPNLWLPMCTYVEESSQPYALGARKAQFRAQTRLWGYQSKKDRSDEAFTNLTIDVAQGVDDKSEAAAENSPIESLRLWERQAEDNVLDRLQEAGLVAPSGEVDKVLETVLQNLQVTNKIAVSPEIRARVLMTTPLESFTVGHTVVVSRGLIDVLPDEASLAAILAHELAHIALGQQIDTKYSFADRLFFNDDESLKKIKMSRTDEEEEAADQKAVQYLKNSPYNDKLQKVGLFLRALSARSGDMPHLIRPLLGNRVAKGGEDMRLTPLLEMAPELHMDRTDEIEALPLGARIKLDPWTDQLHLLKSRTVPLLSAKEKLPFEVTPFMLHLTRENSAPGTAPVAANQGATPNQSATQ
jgi:Peptidase family M48